ncbi:DUF5819 family protein [Melghirimyces algeriensis]|nr:DUF5819 family protein [Melghirimyces algeriensis]
MKRYLPLVWALFLAFALLFHFFVTSLYLTPDNPVKSRWWDSLYAYMDPLFAQNWKFFAPNPVSQHREIWVKGRIRNETGQFQETDWKNITRPLIRQKQKRRIGSDQKVHRYFISGARLFKSDKDSNKKKGEWMLQRVASTALKQMFSEQEIQQIKFRVVTNTFPRFKERQKGDHTTPLHFQESDWLEIQPIPSGTAREWPE